MEEPWNIKTDNDRSSDSLPTFIIFCEDEVSERLYLRFFETEKIKINPIPGQKSMMENVLKALNHCHENLLTESVDGVLQLLLGDTQVWCVFDRDKEGAHVGENEGNIKFDESIALAESKGINVAWSNDAFELWVLLHFEEINPSESDFARRQKYYERLTEYFKNHPNPNEDLQKVLNHASYSYKKDLKSKNNFRSIVRIEMVPMTMIAIERAKKLEAYFNDGNIHSHEKSPCTMIYKLVEELIRVGQKEI